MGINAQHDLAADLQVGPTILQQLRFEALPRRVHLGKNRQKFVVVVQCGLCFSEGDERR